MFGKSGFMHGDLLRGHNQYVGRSLKMNGSFYRETYKIKKPHFLGRGCISFGHLAYQRRRCNKFIGR
ncbi:hypothetical protein FOT63_03405 [Serratia ureilytica]|uniref:Uncharacterized protein n=1 Tax=Serratia ureilytica TaxID=300181 RepID=A0A9X9C6Z2_9GAMM|nr:hypothetical protein FOT63_03405 [Serratia ureilytica]